MANNLASETSPYLLQHKDNPVEWHPWGPEALARASELDRPLLISVGYSSCHWCHVMERESFEDDETAAYMNEHFVNIKVDREERPDVDALYMEAVQGMTGHGGWPMTVFSDPDGVPFYGGTYFPPEPRHGMPSFRQVMEAVVEAYANERDQIRARAGRTREQLEAVARIEPSDDSLDPAILDEAERALLERADRQNGGFRGAPKFPPASAIEFLLTRGERQVVELTLDGMAAGGIYDQIGGGFARYAVDAIWLVPHFEKMLYDNALLARAYLHGWQELGHERYRRVCTETLDWALREMRGPEGGFFAALDADSEGEEGRFYVWSPEEIREVLGGRAEAVVDYFGVTEKGNFEGRNVLHLARGFERPEGFEEARDALYEARARRIWPGLDDKRICSWNALMVSALADAGAVLGRDDYLDAARACANLILGEMRDAEGRLLRTYKDGEARIGAYLEDHAYLVEALLDLHAACFEQRWFDSALEIAEAMIERFADPEHGGFFTVAADGEQLIARRKEIGDHPIPSGNSSAALGLLRLAALTGERRYEDQAVAVIRLFHRASTRHPDAFAHLLRAIDLHLCPSRELALVAPAGSDPGAELAELAAVVRERFRPRLAITGGTEGSTAPPLIAGRGSLDGAAAAYLCENFACRLPVAEAAELRAQLEGDPAQSG